MTNTNTTEPLGQVGLALLRNSAEDTSKLIIYKTKEKILSTLMLTKSLKVYWKPPYLQYHDDLKGFWSLVFTSDSDCNDFFEKLEEVCSIDRACISKPARNEVKEVNKEEKEMTEQASTKFDDTKKSKKDNSDETDSSGSSTVKTKSDVVYRVAKIGHQLPKIKPVADDDSDSTLPSDTERVPSGQAIKSTNNYPEKSTAMSANQLPPKPANFSVALQPSFWPSSTFDLNTFSAENRMQNTEVRMNLSKLDSKIDKVLDNIERTYGFSY